MRDGRALEPTITHEPDNLDYPVATDCPPDVEYGQIKVVIDYKRDERISADVARDIVAQAVNDAIETVMFPLWTRVQSGDYEDEAQIDLLEFEFV